MTACRTGGLAHSIAGEYPAILTTCSARATTIAVARWEPLFDALDAKRALSQGPVFALMYAWEDLLGYYRGGIYRHASGTLGVLHSVAIVGYDDDQGYWIVKNSQGAGWGEGGYARIAYGECSLFDGNGGYQLIV